MKTLALACIALVTFSLPLFSQDQQEEAVKDNEKKKPADVGKMLVEMPVKAMLADAGKREVEMPIKRDSVPAPKEGKVAPGKVNWHASFDKAVEAAAKSGKPVLLFQMLGKLDQEWC